MSRWICLSTSVTSIWFTAISVFDKPFMGRDGAGAQDSVEMAKIVFGDEFVDNNAVMINLINANSPMVFDATMLGAARFTRGIIRPPWSPRLSLPVPCRP